MEIKGEEKLKHGKSDKNSHLKNKDGSTNKKKENPKAQFIDEPEKPEKHSIYIHKVVKLDNKNNQFSEKKFQHVRQISNSKEIISSFRRIGMYLNKKEIYQLPQGNIDKVCFILINNYEKDTETLGVGPLNDAYLFALIHHKLNYKIVFLYNPSKITFVTSLEYFLLHTTNSLTFYYTGKDSLSRIKKMDHGILFRGMNETFSNTDFAHLVSEKSNGKARILIVSDCTNDDYIFNIKAAKKAKNPTEIVSFSVVKAFMNPKQKRKSQGLLTYYFCKLLRQFPNSSPNQMTRYLNVSMQRFKQVVSANLSNESLSEQPLFPDADAAFNGKIKVEQPKKTPVVVDTEDKLITEPIPIENQ